MNSWQAVVVCVVVSLVSQVALGYPRAEGESTPALLKVQEDGDQRQSMFIPIEINDASRSKLNQKETIEAEPKKTREASQSDGEMKPEIMKGEQLGVVRELMNKGADQKIDETMGLTGVQDKEQKEDDTTRSKKSPDMRELSFHTSPLTTVCIQVRSDHRPSSVICGQPLGEDKKDERTIQPPSARYAFPPAPSQAYDPRYMQGGLIPHPGQTPYMRLSPEDIEPSRPFAVPAKNQMMKPQQMPSQGPAMSPKAARGPNALRRTQPEDDNTLKPSEGVQPVPATQPFRVIPQPPPASVVVHKQYYQAAPLPSFPSNLITPSPLPLRFNCALQPEGAQFLQTYATPMLRSAAPGDLSGYVPDVQGYYYDPQGRAAQLDEMMESPYEYGAQSWMGTAVVGEDGQIYRIDDSQPRFAADDQMDQENLRESSPRASSDVSMDDLRTKYYKQDEQLKASNEKIQELQRQIKDIQQRSSVEEDKKKHIPAADTAKENLPAREPLIHEPSDEQKKPMQNKNTKRHSYN